MHRNFLLIMASSNFQVKERTANGNSAYGSHVMQYGDLVVSSDDLFVYMGTNPSNDNFASVDSNALLPPTKAVNQRDADLVHFWDKVILPNYTVLLVTTT